MANTRCRALLLATVGLAWAGACGDPAGPEDAPELFGEWDVVRACGGIGGGCYEPERPATVGVLRPDSVVIEIEGAVAFRYRFMVVEDAATIYGPHDAIRVWDDSAEEWTSWMIVLHLSADSLRLGDNMYDGFTTELARARP